MVADGLPVAGCGIIQDVNENAVPGTVPVGCEDGVFAVVGVHEQEVVTGGIEGDAHVLGLLPGLGFIVPGRVIKVETTHAVKAVRGEIEGFSVGGEHGENLAAQGGKLCSKQLGRCPEGVRLMCYEKASGAGIVGRGVDYALVSFWEIGRIAFQRIQRIWC